MRLNQTTAINYTCAPFHHVFLIRGLSSSSLLPGIHKLPPSYFPSVCLLPCLIQCLQNA